ADARAEGPAALTLRPAERLRGQHLEGEPRDVLALVGHGGAVSRTLAEPHARDVPQRREQGLALGRQERAPFLLGRTRHVDDSIHALADLPLLSRGLEGPRHLAP